MWMVDLATWWVVLLSLLLINFKCFRHLAGVFTAQSAMN